MNKWIVEDWAFEVEVVDGIAKNCRLGLEKGDKFHFEYETPKHFCPRALIEIFTLCEVIRCGGDFTYRGLKKNMKSTFRVHVIAYNFVFVQYLLTGIMAIIIHK